MNEEDVRIVFFADCTSGMPSSFDAEYRFPSNRLMRAQAVIQEAILCAGARHSSGTVDIPLCYVSLESLPDSGLSLCESSIYPLRAISLLCSAFLGRFCGDNRVSLDDRLAR